MFIHKSFLKEVINTPDSQVKKERVAALTFYYFFKSKYTNSIVYDYRSGRRSCLERYAVELDMDFRTIGKYIDLMIKWKLVKVSGQHLQLVNMDSTFEYKTYENCKNDKKYQKKFIKIIIGKKWCIRQVRSFFRVLMFKAVSNNRLLAEINKKEEPFCEEFLKDGLLLARKLVPRRPEPGMNLMFSFGLKLIGKTMGVSKSTAERSINDMVKARIVFRKMGEYSVVRSASDLLVSANEFRKRKYGHMVSKDGRVILKKECNSYAF